MKGFLFTLIFLIAIVFIDKPKAQSTIQCIVHSQDKCLSSCYVLDISYVKNKEETIQKENNIFKSFINQTDDNLFSKVSKRPGGSLFKFNNTRHKWGFITGYGSQKGLDVSYNYEIVFFQFQYYYSLLKKQSWGLEVLLQPQYNAIKYKNNFTEKGN